MSKSWARQGWDCVDESDNRGGGSGGGGGGSSKVMVVWMPPDVTKRFLFLDSDPFCFYEHSLWAYTRSGKDKAICLERNKLDDRGCPPCDDEKWPSFIGYFTVIDMGDVVQGSGDDVELRGWEADNGTVYQFGRKLLGAKKGGKDKPGILKKLQRLAGKHGGRLGGTVWDVYRSGSKSEGCGDEWEFVTKLANRSEVMEYLERFGADKEQLELKPFDYNAVFEPKTYEELQRIVGGRGGQEPPPPSDQDGGFDPDYIDDEIPF